MRARVHSAWSYRGIDTITLENPAIRLDVLTGLGAKIYNLIDLPSGRNLLWHNPRLLPTPAPFGGNFDDWWAGGWDEAFPNAAAGLWNGNPQPFLGELWTRRWESEVVEDGPDAVVHLWVEGIITPARVDKWIRLDRSEPVIRFLHRITNIGYETLDFMWGVHPALDVAPGSRIDLPARKVTVDESRDGKLGMPGVTYDWPMVLDAQGQAVDLRMVQAPEERTYGLLYAHELTDGWLAVSDANAGPSLAIVFPKSVLQSVWLWLVYGGWRGFHHVVVEPWTSYPSRTTEAAEAGRLRSLAPGEILEGAITAVVYRGLTEVTSVSADGHVIGSLAAPN